MHIPRGQIGRPGRVAAGGLGRSAQVRRHADAASDLVLDVADLDADAAVALPVAPALALAALLFAFPRDRLRIPVLIAQAQDADLRRVLDRPRVHAPIQRHTLL